MYTPGPWEMIVHPGATGDYIQILAGSWDIAHNQHSARDWGEELANGRLMAAAPDLLVACEAMVHAARVDDPAMGGVAATLAEAAIAKAKDPKCNTVGGASGGATDLATESGQDSAAEE